MLAKYVDTQLVGSEAEVRSASLMVIAFLAVNKYIILSNSSIM